MKMNKNGQIYKIFSSFVFIISGGDRIDQDFNLLFKREKRWIGQGRSSQSWNKSNLAAEDFFDLWPIELRHAKWWKCGKNENFNVGADKQ